MRPLKPLLTVPFTIHSRTPHNNEKRIGAVEKRTFMSSISKRLKPVPTRCLLVALALLLCGAALSTAAADEQTSIRRAVAEGRIRPLAAILSGLEARYPGAKVVDVEIEHEDRQTLIYEVKMIDVSGRKFKVNVNAASGQVVVDQPSLPAARQMKPMRDLLATALRAHPGWIIDAELITNVWETPYYEIKLRTADGKTKELRANAQTGEFIENDSFFRKNESNLRPLPEAIDAVLNQFSGFIVEAELEFTHGGRPYYEIEIKTDNGRIMEVHVDAQSLELITNGGD